MEKTQTIVGVIASSYKIAEYGCTLDSHQIDNDDSIPPELQVLIDRQLETILLPTLRGSAADVRKALHARYCFIKAASELFLDDQGMGAFTRLLAIELAPMWIALDHSRFYTHYKPNYSYMIIKNEAWYVNLIVDQEAAHHSLEHPFRPNASRSCDYYCWLLRELIQPSTNRMVPIFFDKVQFQLELDFRRAPDMNGLAEGKEIGLEPPFYEIKHDTTYHHTRLLCKMFSSLRHPVPTVLFAQHQILVNREIEKKSVIPVLKGGM